MKWGDCPCKEERGNCPCKEPGVLKIFLCLSLKGQASGKKAVGVGR